jgi:hypothetical protein
MCGMGCTIDGSIVYTLSNAGRSSGVGSFGGVCSRSGILRTRGEEFVLNSLKVAYSVSNGAKTASHACFDQRCVVPTMFTDWCGLNGG